MKQLLIALIALTLTLGVACKKSNDVADSKPTTELIKKSDVKPPVQLMGIGQDPGGIGGYPGGANTYPHNTGACYCGKYSGCHPNTGGSGYHYPDCPPGCPSNHPPKY